MSLDLYRVFYITAIEKNFSKAAGKLYITQPSVSHAIKQLEEKLAVQLFNRTSKGVEITGEGEVLYDYMHQIFGLLDSAERKMSDMKNLESGHVTIGGSDSTCKHYLLPFIQEFQELYPKIQIKLQHGSTPQILDKLNNGLIDLGIVHLPINESRIQLKEFLTIQSIFVVGNRFKEVANNKRHLEELLKYPIISFSETSSSRNFLHQLFQKQGLSVTPDIEVGSVELLMECAKIGMGVAFVTKELVSKELAAGELFEVPIYENIEERTIGLVTQKNIQLSIAADKFYQHLK